MHILPCHPHLLLCHLNESLVPVLYPHTAQTLDERGSKQALDYSVYLCQLCVEVRMTFLFMAHAVAWVCVTVVAIPKKDQIIITLTFLDISPAFKRL